MTESFLSMFATVSAFGSSPLSPRVRGMGGFVREMIRWFIMVAIYDICIGLIAEVLGISRLAACFVFLGIMLAISFAGYVVRQRMSPGIEQDFPPR
jgi:hypothetical protein